MAKVVGCSRDSMIETERLRAEQEAERVAAEAAKRAAMVNMAA